MKPPIPPRIAKKETMTASAFSNLVRSRRLRTSIRFPFQNNLVAACWAELAEVFDADGRDAWGPVSVGDLGHFEFLLLFRDIQARFESHQPLAYRFDDFCQRGQVGLHLLDGLNGQQDFVRRCARHRLQEAVGQPSYLDREGVGVDLQFMQYRGDLTCVGRG